MKSKNIYLIRHGEIGIAGEKRYIGVLDLPLNTNGILQAKKLKVFFNDVKLDKMFCSNLQRSVQTAQIILEEKSIQIEKIVKLREINMGNWEGKLFKEIKEKFPSEFKSRLDEIEDFKPSGGESFKDCQIRAINIFSSIAKGEGQNIAIVAHAGINRGIIAYLLGVPLKNIFKFGQHYGCINKIIFDGDNFKLSYMNYFL
jgi:alpha-ribazole phosphatase